MQAYLDNAATTEVTEDVYEAMLPYFKDSYGNPNSLHTLGIRNRKTINSSRKKIAQLLNCSHKELHFTSGGTESINWAIKGIAANSGKKNEIITTRIEHHATLHSCDYLEKQGYKIHYLDVDNEGFINITQLKSFLSSKTLLVSIIMVNNEIGTIQDIERIGRLCQKNKTYLHVDAVQALTHIKIDLDKMNADLVSFSGHKLHAPKGIGMLYIKEGTNIENLIHGGQQEYGHRAGTENVAYIVGLTKAIELGLKHMETNELRLQDYVTFFLNELDKHQIEYRLNGPGISSRRLPGNLNLSFKDQDGSDITYYLNKYNIAVSTGSACDSERIDPSHVLQAIKVPDNYINASIRVSIGDSTTFEEVRYACRTLIRILKFEIE